MRKRVYIAGPISRGRLADNVEAATAAFRELMDAGFAPFCPHWSVFSGGGFASGRGNTIAGVGHGNGHLPDDYSGIADWLDVDLPWVAVADAVLRLPGESTGADVETDYAQSLGVPVFHSVAEIVAWFVRNQRVSDQAALAS